MAPSFSVSKTRISRNGRGTERSCVPHPKKTKSEPSGAGPILKGGRTLRMCSFRGSYANRGNGTELRSRPKGPNRKPFARLPIWKGGAKSRYKVFGASPQTDAENVVSTVCSDAVVPVAGVEPARVISPTDFESVTSANSITPACASHITISSRQLQALFPRRRFPAFRRGPSSCRQSVDSLKAKSEILSDFARI